MAVLATLAMIVPGLGALTEAPAAGSAVSGTSVNYTTDEDFNKGILVNVNHDAPNNHQLQLNKRSGTFPFIWVALSQRCTIAKINTATGAILGEYRTLPDGAGATCFQESSRTTVATDGSAWVGHRATARVTHVGLNELNECIDRNNNGTIETSTGYGNVLAWPGALGTGVSAATDECILHHVNTNPAGQGSGDSRHMSIDADGNLWVGNRASGSIFHKVSGTTGAILAGPFDWNCGGYGGLIDGHGVIWSASSGGSVLRWDPNAPTVFPNGNLPSSNPRCIPVNNNYGMAIDRNGFVWVSVLFGSIVYKISPDGNAIQTFSKGPGASGTAQGLAVDGNGDVWISSSLFCSSGCTVTHLRNNGTFVGNVPTPTGAGSTGVSIDADGKVWTANRTSHTATRINPALNGGVGAVDLTVAFPAGPDGRPLPSPYNYSDMTGAQLLSSTAPQGSWTVVQDGGAAGTDWGRLTWNTEPQGDVPAGTSILVEARAADTEAALGAQPFTAVSNGVAFSLPGRFIQVRATLKASAAGESPVLSDIKIETANKPPVFDSPDCGSTLVVNTGDVLTFDVRASDPDAGQNVTLTGVGLPSGATMDPALPASGNPVVSTFSWSPAPADEGTHALAFFATDPFGAQTTCTTSIEVKALVMTGRALVAKTTTSSGGISTLVAAQDTGEISTKVPLTKELGGDVSAPPIAGSVLEASVVAVVGRSEARATAAHVVIGDPSSPTIEAAGLEAYSRTTCAGSTGQGRVATLSINGEPVPLPAEAEPNTTITLPEGITVILNEHVGGANAGVLQVNAVHVKSAVLDVVLASARSDIHNCV